MTFQADLAKILNTTEANALKRATGLKILPPCGRCGGSGQYSFNQIDGSRCYGCNGTGQRAPKTADEGQVLAEAEAAATDGRLATYLEYLEARGMAKRADEKIMAAWRATGISSAYRWQDATKPGRDRDISEINAKMAAAYDRVSKAAMKAAYPGKDGDRQALTLEAARLLTEGLAEVEAASAELQAYLLANPIREDS